MRLFIRWLVTAISVAAAVLIVPGFTIEAQTAWLAIAIMAAVLGLVNAFIRPILAFLSCGCIVATLGLFIFVVNAACFYLAAWVSTNWFNAGVQIDGFWPALWASVVVSIVSFVLSIFVPDESD